MFYRDIIEKKIIEILELLRSVPSGATYSAATEDAVPKHQKNVSKKHKNYRNKRQKILKIL